MHSVIESEFKCEFVNLLKGLDNTNYDLLLSYAYYILINGNNEVNLSFAYSIVLLYFLKTNDAAPLEEFSIIFGFTPILKIIHQNDYRDGYKIKDFLSEYYLYNNVYKNKLLTSGQKIIYRLIDEESDYSLVAPTSYGKTDLMIESVFKSKGDVVIIVPLVALLNQIKKDIYEQASLERVKVKVITHHEIAPSEKKKNIFVLTQERCYQIIKTRGFSNLSNLFIDESHKILSKDSRSYKLSEVIFILKYNQDITVKYYSPVLIDARSIKIKGLYPGDIKFVQGIRDLKTYIYYFYVQNKKRLFIPYTEKIDSKYTINSGYINDFDYIIKNSKNKNIIFYNSPRVLEKEAIRFSESLDLNNKIDLDVIKGFIGDEYYIIDTLKKGVIYIHSQMPDIVKIYLLELYKKNKEIRYLFTNSSILEGVNTPSDCLFIKEYKIGSSIMKPIDLINLRGRINRIKDIVLNNDLSRIFCEIHFLLSPSQISKAKKLINGCYDAEMNDVVENLFLEKPIENLEDQDNLDTFEKSITKINLIKSEIDLPLIFNIIPKIDYLDDFSKICLKNDIKLNSFQQQKISEKIIKYTNQNIDNINDLLLCVADLFSLDLSEEYKISRLSHEKTRKFYAVLMTLLIQGKSIKEKAQRMKKHYEKVGNDKLIYVGPQLGEEYAEMYNGKLTLRLKPFSEFKNDNGKTKILSKLFIKNNKTPKELFNICVVKIKVEEEFISFVLLPFIESIQEFNKGIIKTELYEMIKFQTNDEFEISLIKEGVSPYLAKALNYEKYKKFIAFDDGIIIDKKILGVFNGNDLLKNELKLNLY